MIIEGQVHGGLTEALAIAMGQKISYDEFGNMQGRQPDRLLPADRRRDAGLGDRLHSHPGPHHPMAPRASVKAPTSAACRRSPTPSTTPSRTRGCRTPRCRMTTGGCGRRLKGSALPARRRPEAGGQAACTVTTVITYSDIKSQLVVVGYLADDTWQSRWNLPKLGRPLLVEGAAGVGKTERWPKRWPNAGDAADPTAVL